MENNEQNLGSQEPTTSTNPVKTVNVKLIGIIVAALAIILVVFFMFFTRSAKSTVKDYMKAMEKCDAKKVMAIMDFEGTAAFSNSKRDLSDFDDQYEKIMDKIKEMDKDEKKAYEETKDKLEERLQKLLDEAKDQKIKYTVKNIKTEKVDGSKKLTKVTCDIKMKSKDDEDTAEDVSFYVMKKGFKYYIVSSGI